MQHFLLDENLSRRLVDALSATFSNITHVVNEGLPNSSDADIWQYAKPRNSIIITKDHDFSDMSHLYGCPPKIIKLTCGNKTTQFISELLSANVELIHNFAASDKCYLEIF